MLKRTIFKIHFYVACVVIAIGSNVCYAETYTVPIEVGCSSSPEEAVWEEYDGEPDAQLTLTTDGMKIAAEGGKIVTEWDDYDIPHDGKNMMERSNIYGKVDVTAECTPYLEEGGLEIMFSEGKSKGRTLACPKGSGLRVKFAKPSGNPGDFTYLGTLTVVRDDEKKVEEKVAVKEEDKAQQKNPMEEKKMQESDSKGTKTTEKKQGQQPSKCTQFCNQEDLTLSSEKEAFYRLSMDTTKIESQQGYGVMEIIRSFFPSSLIFSQ